MLPLLLALLLAPARAAEAPSRPRLVAVIVVDQMRADYLERFRGRATGGFARFLKDGAVYTQARQLHVPTETCPGHAALSTGEMPDAHGIVGNDWREAAGGDEVYCASDARFNRGPGRLAATALADRLKEADPASKALAISGKDRAAIMLGGHKPDAAIWIDRGGAPTTSGYYGEFPAWAKSAASATPAKPDELDRLTLELALAGLRAMSLGADEHPDLLLLSFSATDYIGHAHGPDSAQIGEDLEALDARLARLFEALDAQAGKGRWAAFLSADHGV
ncbi:MAG TPA: alkaline phosphatase family protein, partial [Elusimicrobiota bacterium]|nr:alkaline phosphatase family protein [Elusimicrobiota bacterium]